MAKNGGHIKPGNTVVTICLQTNAPFQTVISENYFLQNNNSNILQWYLYPFCKFRMKPEHPVSNSYWAENSILTKQKIEKGSKLCKKKKRKKKEKKRK